MLPSFGGHASATALWPFAWLGAGLQHLMCHDCPMTSLKKVKETPRSGILRPRGTVVHLWLSGCAFSIPIPLYITSLGRTTTSDAPARMT